MEEVKKRQNDFYFQRLVYKFFGKNMFLLMKYKKKKEIIRIPIPLNLFWSFNPFLAKQLLLKPEKFFPQAEEVLGRFCRTNGFFKTQNELDKLKFKIDLYGPFYNRQSSVKDLKSNFLGELVWVRGIVIECEEKKIQKKTVVYHSPSTEKFFINKEFGPKKVHYILQKDSEGKFLETEFGLSTFEDFQKIIIQDKETFYKIPAKISICLKNDLVNICQPGDSVEICGVLKPVPETKFFEREMIFSMGISALSIRLSNLEVLQKLTKSDLMMIKSFSNLNNSFERLSSLIAPNVLGQVELKKGVLLSMAGGGEKKAPRKAVIGEEINFLMVGGFSNQKEKLLNFITKHSPRKIFRIQETSLKNPLAFIEPNIIEMEKTTLEMGGPNFFSKGTFLARDLDKISEAEKVVLKEILDFQNISFSRRKFRSPFRFKFNLIGTMEFSNSKKNFLEFIKNELDSSRTIFTHFDFIFFFSEKNSLGKDKEISDHLIQNHRRGYGFPKSNTRQEPKEIFGRGYSKPPSKEGKMEYSQKHLSYNFLKSFFLFIKFHIYPVLSGKAIETAIDSYLEWKFSEKNFFPVSIRKIETIIRMTLAYSKCHLREIASEKDVKFINFFLKKLTFGRNQDSNRESNSFLRDRIPRSPKISPILKHSNKIKNKKNKWFIKQGGFFFKGRLRKFTKKNLEFSFLKLFFTRKDQKSWGERIIFEWSKKKLCFIFPKIILRV